MNICKEEFLIKLKTIKRTKVVKPITKEPMDKVAQQINFLYKKNECYFLNELSRCQKLIINHVKNRDFSSVDQLIYIAKEVLNKLRGEPRMLGAIYLYPSFAYYASKTNKISLARRYMSLTYKYDDMLTDKFPILHLHKLYHILNSGKLFVYSKQYSDCAKLFTDFFSYLATLKLNSKYGTGGKSYFFKMQPDYHLSTVSSTFISSYFMIVWEHPTVEKYMLNSKETDNIINLNIKDTYLKALRDTWMIQKSFLIKKPNYDLALTFFEKYDSYLFDPLRLLILRSLLKSLEILKEKKIVEDFIISKLNFKNPNTIMERLSNQLKEEAL